MCPHLWTAARYPLSVTLSLSLPLSSLCPALLCVPFSPRVSGHDPTPTPLPPHPTFCGTAGGKAYFPPRDAPCSLPTKVTPSSCESRVLPPNGLLHRRGEESKRSMSFPIPLTCHQQRRRRSSAHGRKLWSREKYWNFLRSSCFTEKA